MTDMRRTLLWVVFTMSLVLLWDAWSRHNGQPTLFGGPVPAASAAAVAASHFSHTSARKPSPWDEVSSSGSPSRGP